MLQLHSYRPALNIYCSAMCSLAANCFPKDLNNPVYKKAMKYFTIGMLPSIGQVSGMYQ